MMEIDPGYVDVICNRYEEYTKDKPKLIGNFLVSTKVTKKTKKKKRK